MGDPFLPPLLEWTNASDVPTVLNDIPHQGGGFSSETIHSMDKRIIEELGLQGIEGKFEKADDRYITQVERELKIVLPTEFREFLKTFGASLFPEEVVFKSLEPSPWSVDGLESFDLFYGMSGDSGFDLLHVNLRVRGDIPIGTIAIGHDSGSNLILLSCETGAVLFYDRETGKTSVVARSFTRFIQSFRRLR